MDQLANQQKKSNIDKGKKMSKLLENELFQELFMDDYIKQGLYEISINFNLDNPDTVDRLKARQSLHKYIFQVLTDSGISSL